MNYEKKEHTVTPAPQTEKVCELRSKAVDEILGKIDADLGSYFDPACKALTSALERETKKTFKLRKAVKP